MLSVKKILHTIANCKKKIRLNYELIYTIIKHFLKKNLIRGTKICQNT